MDRECNPSVSRESEAATPPIHQNIRRPSDLESPDTQPYIPLSRRRPLKPGDEANVDELVERLKLHDPEFIHEVLDAFKGAFSTFDVEILDWRHVEGNQYAFTAKVDGVARELRVERKPSPR